MFDALFKVVPLAGNGLQWLLERNAREREKFASLCDRISQQLESFAKASTDQRQSRNLCAELKVYVPELEQMAEDLVNGTQLRLMAAELNSVCEAWARHSAKMEDGLHVAERDLYEIEDAAGHFRGLATLVRTM